MTLSLRRLAGLVLGLMVMAGAPGCSLAGPVAKPADQPTATSALPSATPTLTPVWFPATETPTPPPIPTPLPTQDERPPLGSLLVGDDFTTADAWELRAHEAGTIALGQHELTLAVTGEKGVLSSLRSGTLPADVFIEITVYPSLCGQGDVFGLFLRAQSPRDGYRLLVSCDGRLRLERLKNGELVVLQDWLASAALPPGGMAPVRLGAAMQGRDMTVFVEGNLQFTVRDPVWGEGQVGVYARAAQEGPLTVNFSDLKVYALTAGSSQEGN